MVTQILGAHAHVGLVVRGIGEIGAQRHQIVEIHTGRSQQRSNVSPDKVRLLLLKWTTSGARDVREVAMRAEL